MCETCAPGKYMDDTGSSSSACKDCAAGRISAAGQIVCTQCLAGTYANSAQDTCELCDAGKWTRARGVSFPSKKKLRESLLNSRQCLNSA